MILMAVFHSRGYNGEYDDLIAVSFADVNHRTYTLSEFVSVRDYTSGFEQRIYWYGDVRTEAYPFRIPLYRVIGPD